MMSDLPPDRARPEPIAYYVEHKKFGVELSFDPPSEDAVSRGWVATPLYAWCCESRKDGHD